MERFGIHDAEEVYDRYPHTLSGGMKQRVVITMVVALKPLLIIADEPTTALDPTVQASVLALFEQIRQEYNISIILISHNISVVAKFCEYIYVMYAGKIVERGTRKDIFTNPAHPYTWGAYLGYTWKWWWEIILNSRNPTRYGKLTYRWPFCT